MDDLLKRYSEAQLPETEIRWTDYLGRVIANPEVPRDEIWFVEEPGPLARKAGFLPRIVGKIVGIGSR